MSVIHKATKFMGKLKIKNQLLIIYSFILSIPILLIGAFLVFNTRRLLLENYETQITSDNLRVKSIMYDVTTNIYNMSEEILAEDSLISLITKNYESTNDAYKAIQNYSELDNYLINASVSDIAIYTTNPDLTSSKNLVLPVTDSILETDWYQKATSQVSAFWTSTLSTDSGGNEYYELCLIRKIPLIYSSSQAVICIKVNRNYLKNRIQNTDYLITTSVNQAPVFFSTNRILQDRILPFYIDYEAGFYNQLEDIEYNGSVVLSKISTLRIYSTDDFLYITTIDTGAYESIQSILFSCMTIILIAAFIPFCIMLVYTKRFSKRISSLRQAMHMASMGDYNIKDTFRGDDELSETFSDLKIMVKNIKEKDAQVYEEQINKQKLKNEQQQIELKMLASQINPHFLYNTLETIRMQAFTSGNKQVATSIKLLGKSLHYVLENTGTFSTTLRNELDYIKTYLAIQKLRFNDRVNYTLTVEEGIDLDNYQILPLLLQPIVENAILHGLDGVEENGQIKIDVSTIPNEVLQIRISDNGIGMELEELDKLTKKVSERNTTTTSSIGLYNINQRIKLCYGNEYGMKIDSFKNEGTHVFLTLPLNYTWEE